MVKTVKGSSQLKPQKLQTAETKLKPGKQLSALPHFASMASSQTQENHKTRKTYVLIVPRPLDTKIHQACKINYIWIHTEPNFRSI